MAPILPEWLDWYKKPTHQDFRAYASSLREKFERAEEDGITSPRSSFISGSSDVAVPHNLTLERVLNHKTCTPMSLYDFYMYLKHIEFSPENLEFYLWLQDYERRYKKSRNSKDHNEKSADTITVRSVGSDEKSDVTTVVNNGYDSADELDVFPTEYSQQFISYIEGIVISTAAKFPRPCLKMPDSPGTVVRPTRAQERRRELIEVTNLFLIPGAEKELNIPASMRKKLVADLQTSDAPENFAKVSGHVYSLLKNCSHRNFVRLGVNNGSFEHLCMVTFMGIMFNTMGLLTMFLLAFKSPGIHESSRWRGLYTIPFWLMGMSLLFAGWRGSCFFMLVVAHRQPLPWERLEDDESIKQPEVSRFKRIKFFLSKLMFFDKKIRVSDVGLRRLQHKIALQSCIGALIGTAILEVFFLSLPIWKHAARHY